MRPKSYFLLAILSICCGFLAFITFRHFTVQETFIGGGCIILSFDETEEDLHIQETLAALGFNGFVSESSVEVALHDYGSIEMISLDTFKRRIESFDPRNDGYAARLGTFFVRTGQRFFYYHFDDAAYSINVRNLERQLKEFFPDTPFTLTVLGQRREILWDFLLLSSACLGAFLLSRKKLSFFFQLPVLLSFCLGGIAGIALAGLLAGIWELLREPLLQLSAARRYNQLSSDIAEQDNNGIWEWLKPYKTNLFFTVLFSIFIIIIIITADLSFVPILIGITLLCLINYQYFSFESNTAGKGRHIPFIPVLLFPHKTKTFSLFPFLLPFALLSLSAFILSVFFSNPMDNITTVDKSYLISTEEYNRHMELAHSF